jgi:hypothetical protein
MSPKVLKMLIVVKSLVLLGLVGFLGRDYIQDRFFKKIDAVGKTIEPSKKQVGEIVIPKGDVSVVEGNEIRAQLEFLKKDAENRLAAIVEARKGYDNAKTAVEEKLKRIEEERRFLDETLQKEKKVKEERLTETIEFISKMEPRKAAVVLEGMDRDLVIALMKKLPARFVTKALESMSPKKTVEYMEYYTRIRSGREYELMKELGLCKPDNAGEPAVGAAPQASPAPAIAPAPIAPVASPVPPSAVAPAATQSPTP